MIGLGFGNFQSGAGDSFIYLAEQISTDFAWSVIQLNSNVANCLRLRNTTTQAEQDFGFDSNKVLDTASISTWLGGDSAKIVTFYDASGNSNNATETAEVRQEDFNINGGVDSKPCIDDNASAYNTLHYAFDSTVNESLETSYLDVSKTIDNTSSSYQFSATLTIYGRLNYNTNKLNFRDSTGGINTSITPLSNGAEALCINIRDISGNVTAYINDLTDNYGGVTKTALLNQTHLRGVRNGNRNTSALIKFSSELSAGDITTVKTWYNTNFNKSLVV